MDKAYLIVFSNELGTRQQMQNYLDAIDSIHFWYACLPYCIFCTSDLSADGI